MSKKSENKPKFNTTNWMAQHKGFVEFWKEHRHSGHCYARGGYTNWGILPWEAYEMERYRAEFTGWSPDPIINAQIDGWREEQKDTERLSAILGSTHDAEHNAKVYEKIWEEYGTPEHGGFNGIRKQWEEDGTIKRTKGEQWTAESMRAKIDEAYSGPYLSEEEQEALRRRRDDENRD